MRRRPVGKVDWGWASLSSLPPSLVMAPLVPWVQHHDSDLLTQAQWILPSSFLSISMSSLLPGLSGRHHLSCSAFCLLPQPHFLSSPSGQLCLSCTGLQPIPPHRRTFALAISLPGMLCSHGLLFLVIQV